LDLRKLERAARLNWFGSALLYEKESQRCIGKTVKEIFALTDIGGN
jgi:hypothetical protein